MRTFEISGHIGADKRAALGDVCIHFSILEFKVEQTIWAFRGHGRKIGRLQTRRAFFRSRITALRKEVKKRFDVLSKEYQWFDTFANQAEVLARDRNLFVHGVWCKGNFTGARRNTYVLSYFDNPTGRAQETTVEGLVQLRDNIARLINLLDRKVPKILGAPLP